MLFKSQTQHGDKDERQILSARRSNWEFTHLFSQQVACGFASCHNWRRAVRSATRDRNHAELVRLNLAEPRDSYRDGACQKGAPVPNPSMARRRGKSYLSTRRQKMSPPYQVEETVPEGGACGGGGGRKDAQLLGAGEGWAAVTWQTNDRQMTRRSSSTRLGGNRPAGSCQRACVSYRGEEGDLRRGSRRGPLRHIFCTSSCPVPTPLLHLSPPPMWIASTAVSRVQSNLSVNLGYGEWGCGSRGDDGEVE